MIKLGSLKFKITIFFLFLISVYFVINLTLNVCYINNEKKEDLRLLLSHALSESCHYVNKQEERIDLDFLYYIAHMTPILNKSGARNVLFFFTKEKYKPNSNEIVVSAKINNGTYINLKSVDDEVKKLIYSKIKTAILNHLIFLVVIGILGIYFINRMLLPLSHLSRQCKNYKDGNDFYISNKSAGIEIKQIKASLNMLVRRFRELRKKDKEVFATATHELKTPLAIIKARVDSYQERKDYSKTDFIGDINEDIQRLYLEIKSMLYFNVFDFDEKESFDVKKEIEDLILQVDLLLKNNKLDVLIVGESFDLFLRKNLFLKMFTVIFENAIFYAKIDSVIEIFIENKIIKLKNEQGSKINLFSSKLGIKILEKLSKELEFTFDIFKDDKYYEVVIYFN